MNEGWEGREEGRGLDSGLLKKGASQLTMSLFRVQEVNSKYIIFAFSSCHLLVYVKKACYMYRTNNTVFSQEQICDLIHQNSESNFGYLE